MGPAGYVTMIEGKGKESKMSFRLEPVCCARRNGISPEVLNLPPVFLDEEFKKSYLSGHDLKVGHHEPVEPVFFNKDFTPSPYAW